MGTITSLMKSPISSVLIRFSMLSLTFCSWPDKVCMTNHWLCMRLELKKHKNLEQNLVNRHREPAQDHNRNRDHNRRALQLVPRWPRALAYFFARRLHV